MGEDAREVGGRGGRSGEESEMGGDVNLTTSQLALLQH